MTNAVDSRNDPERSARLLGYVDGAAGDNNEAKILPRLRKAYREGYERARAEVSQQDGGVE